MTPNRACVPLRLLRILRLLLHLTGLLVAWLGHPRRAEASRRADLHRWSQQLLAILSVSVRKANAPHALPAPCMLVLNHVSWLDIFVIDANYPATFVAKAEVRRWPVIGWLCTRAGTLYIERGKRSAARAAREKITAELARGMLVAVFPEGMTSFGLSLERFHAALFQPAIDAGAVIQPAALRYLDRTGERVSAAAYVGETSLLESVWAIVSTRHMIADLSFLAQISCRGENRRVLAAQAESAIADALGVPGPRDRSRGPHSRHRAPESDGDHRDGRR